MAARTPDDPVDLHMPDEPPPELRFRRRIRPLEALVELWRSRVLVRTLVERELRVRYKQAYLGVAWALVGPVSTLIVFTFIFQNVVEVTSGGVPYPLYSFIGLLAWGLFASGIGGGSFSLLSNMSLLNKVYCPREVFPLSSVAIAGVDTATGLIALVGLFVLESFVPKATSVYVPLILVVHLAFTIGVVLVMSSVVVYLRDLRHLVGFVLQLGLFVTPVAYGLEEIPTEWLELYCLANPLGPIIDSYRRTVLQGMAPDWELLGLGAITSFVLLVVGYRVFKRLETGIADVA